MFPEEIPIALVDAAIVPDRTQVVPVMWVRTNEPDHSCAAVDTAHNENPFVGDR